MFQCPSNKLNSSFLVKKSIGVFHLLMTFADIGCYNNLQPSLMADVDSTLPCITQWKHLVFTNVTNTPNTKYPLFRTPWSTVMSQCLSKGFKSVYAQRWACLCGSWPTLEGLMCCVLGHLQQDGVVAKICLSCFTTGRRSSRPSTNATDAYHNDWVDLELRDVNSRSFYISTPASCSERETVRHMRSFIGAYKVLARVISLCSSFLASPDDAVQPVVGWKSSKVIFLVRWPYRYIPRGTPCSLLIASSPLPSDLLW